MYYKKLDNYTIQRKVILDKMNKSVKFIEDEYKKEEKKNK